MDTRTVISGISYGNEKTLREITGSEVTDNPHHGLLRSELEGKYSSNRFEEIISWITQLKFFAELEVERIPLNSVKGWLRNDHSIFHREHKYFSVIAVSAEIENREVRCWSQPLVRSAQEGIIAFIMKEINGVYHFLVQAKMEPGNLDLIEMAPTVQCLTGSYREGENEYQVEYLEYVLEPEKHNAKVHYSALQSEEGGRFYQEQNRNVIIEVGLDFDIAVPERFFWMTLSQIKAFIKFNNYLNIQSRSLLSMIQFV